jgi:tripartite-type tricarboxylate transporter receptor subunit TctC
MRLRLLSGILLVVTVALAPAPATAQTYPAKPVRIILPYLGGTEFVGRWLAAKMSPGLGQQVVIDPRPGAGGNIGHEATAKAPADGYILMLAAPPFVLNPILNPRISYDIARDFSPIALVATLPNMLAVHPSVPAKSLRELVQLARAHPGKIAYGSGGVGSANHLAFELLQGSAKIQFTHVPYKSASFGLIGAMSGDVDMVITVVSDGARYVKDGRMRGLAVLDTKRAVSMPEVPTSVEAGLPDWQMSSWFGLMAPAGTSKASASTPFMTTVTALSATAPARRRRSRTASVTAIV